MQIVINISEENYKNIKEQVDKRDYPDMQTGRAIANGTPLPKGHGRLIDADKAIDLLNQKIDEHDKMMAKYEPYQNTQIPNWMWEGGVCNQSTIIEADKESEEQA